MRTQTLITLAALLVACGSDDDPGDTAAGPSSSSAGSGASGGSGGSAGGSASGGGGAATGGGPTDEQILAAKWVELEEAPSITGKQDDLSFIDADHGWSINGLGRIYGTSDGGASWTKLLDQPGTYFRAVTFLDAQRGFAANIGTDYFPGVTDEVPLYRTADGGVSWAPVTEITGPMPKGICNFSTLGERIVATGRVGGPAFVAISEDGGDTWASQDVSDTLAMLVDSHFVDTQTGFITGGSATTSLTRCVIARTDDGGATWTEAFKSKTPGMCWKLSFPSPQVGYAAVLPLSGSSGTFVKTTDGGQTWEELPFVDSAYGALGIGFITEQIGWIGGEASTEPAYRTQDGGLTWQPDDSLGPYINRFRFVDAHTAYAIGSSIYKLEIE
jgi:photosystem II stability/assembly factor-like uncharacterized protein